jgi:sugar lactone lactonase YvrE
MKRFFLLLVLAACEWPGLAEPDDSSGRLDGRAARLEIRYGHMGGWGSAEGFGHEARLAHANDIVPVGDGTFYVLDCYGIERFDPHNGQLKNLYGRRGEVGYKDGVGAEARFRCPDSLVDDHQGHLYVADTDNLVIRRITKETSEVTTIAGAGRGKQVALDGVGADAHFYYPLSPFLYQGALFVVDGIGAAAVRRVDLRTRAVTTFAGQLGTPGNQDGVGNAAQFGQLDAAAFDGQHTAYLHDGGNHTVRTLDLETRTVRTIAGNGTSDADGPFEAVRFGSIASLSLLGDKLYMVDNRKEAEQAREFKGSRLRVLDLAARTVTTLAGSGDELGVSDGGGRDARFNRPSGLTATADQIYIVDSASTVRVYENATRAVTTLAGSSDFPGRGPWGATLPELGFVGRGINGSQGTAGMVASRDGAVFVADSGTNSIQRLTPAADGQLHVERLAKLGGLAPAALALSEDGKRIYATTPRGIAIIDLMRRNSQLMNGFNLLGGIAVKGDDLFVTDNTIAPGQEGESHVLRVRGGAKAELVTTGKVEAEVVAGGKTGFADGTGEDANFGYAQGLTVSGEQLFVADPYNHRIRVIDLKTRVVTTWAGGATAGYSDGVGTAAQFYYPQDLALDGHGNLLVADSGNALVRRAKLASRDVKTVVGVPREYGVRLAPARLNHPMGVAQTPLGVLVSDEQGVFLVKESRAGD